MALFRGLSAFPLTPADAAGRVDTEAFGRILARLLAAGVDSVGLLGSTGTYAYLSRHERRRAVEAAAEVLGGRMPLMVGVGALRTDEAEGLARDAEVAGADALLLAPVSYTPLTQDEVFEHVGSVVGVTGLPLCLYNNPSTTHFTFGLDLLERLGRVPGVRAVKMPAPAAGDGAAEIAELRRRTPLLVGYSGDWCGGPTLLAGADAWYSVMAGLLPRLALRLCRAASAGDSVNAKMLDVALHPLWDRMRAYGGLRVMEVLCRLAGLGPLTLPRPVLPLSGDDRARVEAVVSPLLALEEALVAEEAAGGHRDRT